MRTSRARLERGASSRGAAPSRRRYLPHRPPACRPPSRPAGRAPTTCAPRGPLRHLAGGGEEEEEGRWKGNGRHHREAAGGERRPPPLPAQPVGCPGLLAPPVALGVAAARGPAVARAVTAGAAGGGGSSRRGVPVVPASGSPGSASPCPLPLPPGLGAGGAGRERPAAPGLYVALGPAGASARGTVGCAGRLGAAFLRARRSREAGRALSWVGTVSAGPSRRRGRLRERMERAAPPAALPPTPHPPLPQGLAVPPARGGCGGNGVLCACPL